MVEVKIYQDKDFIHKVFDPDFRIPTLDIEQRKLVITTLKPKCEGCVFNNNGCATMKRIDDDMHLLDENDDYVSTEWCDAVGIGVEV